MTIPSVISKIKMKKVRKRDRQGNLWNKEKEAGRIKFEACWSSLVRETPVSE